MQVEFNVEAADTFSDLNQGAIFTGTDNNTVYMKTEIIEQGQDTFNCIILVPDREDMNLAGTPMYFEGKEEISEYPNAVLQLSKR